MLFSKRSRKAVVGKYINKACVTRDAELQANSDVTKYTELALSAASPGNHS